MAKFSRSRTRPRAIHRRQLEDGNKGTIRRQSGQCVQKYWSPFRCGKICSSRNSYRHGLSAPLQLSAERQKHVEELARKIADNISDEVTLELARTAAVCEIDLRRIRAAKVAAIERMLKFGLYDALSVFTNTPGGEDAASLLATDQKRTAEAVRRALPDLIRIERYERVAATLRERSLRAVIKRMRYKKQL